MQRNIYFNKYLCQGHPISGPMAQGHMVYTEQREVKKETPKKLVLNFILIFQENQIIFASSNSFQNVVDSSRPVNKWVQNNKVIQILPFISSIRVIMSQFNKVLLLQNKFLSVKVSFHSFLSNTTLI